MRAIVIAGLALVACSGPELEPVAVTRQALGAPVVTTNAATSVLASSATLNALGNPNEAATTGYFRYSTSNPVVCNDTFGTRLPSSSFSDVALGAGMSAVPYSFAASSLLPGTTYYYCALATNSFGTSFGAVLSFTTLPAAPTTTTGASSNRTGTSATLNGVVNPGGTATTAWFRYAPASPGTCNDSFGTRAPISGGTAIPAGTSNVAFNQAITGLTPGTTYYYCAIAQNSVGTTFGLIQTFVTPLPPTATTVAASSVTNAGATLNGQGTPNGATTTGWLRYSTTNPGVCDDVFGSRAPVSGGSTLGSGYAAQAYSQSITGLSPGTTYFFCAIASSAEGTAFGSVLSFTTANAPTATTSAATLVTSSSATMNGSGNPNGAATTAWFRYSTSNPLVCDDTFGVRSPSSSFSDSPLGSGTSPVSFSRGQAGLLPGTTYYFCAITSNAYGTTFGAVLSFTTLPAAPAVSTGSATNRTGTTATLNGSVNPNGGATTGWFRFSATSPATCNDTFGSRAPASGGSSIPAGTSTVAFAQGISGLAPGTTYYYCAIAQNSVATSFGTVQSFTTPVPPTATTLAASSVTNSSATLNGQGNPNGSSTTGWFRYSLTNPGVCDDVFGSRAPTSGGWGLGGGTAAQAYSQSVIGLSPGTTYFFCAITSSAEGTAFGSVLSFTTANAPTATTSAATLVTSSSATMNGSGNPNGAATTAWFRYSTSNPLVCDDSFGVRSPSSSFSDSPLGSGTSPVSFSRGQAGLLPGTTYYFCAITSNAYGTSFGPVLSFTTLPAAPTVSTGSATNRTGTTATLNGSVNPNGGATTGWFRFSATSPATCNDTFGSRAPASGGSSIPAGPSTVAFAQGISGLAPATTYYYCAIAQNSVGLALGTLQSFTTPVPPTATTLAASPVTSSSATLNGQGNPNGSSTTGWFRYSTTNPGVCDDVFGSRAPAAGGSALGGGTAAQAYSQSVGGLSPATTYFFCAVTSSAEGTAFGSVLSFTTPSAPPTIASPAATMTTPNATSLTASVNPSGSATMAWFRYATMDPGTCTDTFGTRAPATGGVAVGAGNTPSVIGVPISSLLPATTYFFCALASNSAGATAGAIASFTTPAQPATTTQPASLISSTGATLNASTNPNLSLTALWFRYATTNPGACDDTFGTRTPAMGGIDLGSGAGAVVTQHPLTGLTPGTTYFACAIAQNTWGTTFGGLVSFTTAAAAPAVTTLAASAITATGATLNGSATPNGAATLGWFRYSATNPGTCNDTFGTRAPATGGTSLGSGATPAAFSEVLSGLAPGTTWFVCAIASSSAGLSVGAVTSFSTPVPPTVTTLAPTLVTSTGATLNGEASPNGAATTGWFRYATTNPGTCDDTFGTRAPGTGGLSLGAGSTTVPFSTALTGLTPATTYFVCAIAQSANGLRTGGVQSFTTATPLAPQATTSPATSVQPTTATLNGAANPNGAATTGFFRFATTTPGTCNDTFGTRVPATGGTVLGAGTTSTTFSEALTGLAPGTTFFFCALAQNTNGLGVGAVQTFTTPFAPQAPTVLTSPATALTGTAATLNGSANPNGQATTAWFRYATTNPGTCDDVFGTRSPSTGGTSLGSGSTAAAFSEPLTGLAPGTTYFFCALGQNATGTGVGAVQTFTTPSTPQAPTVLTSPATALTGTAATLNGSANPNGQATTAWFRYATTNPGTCDDVFGTRSPSTGGTSLGSGTTAAAFSEPLTGLAPGTTYFFCALGQNATGTGVGAVQTFTTPSAPQAPTVLTSPATALTGTAATLNGSANPNGQATTAWFRYATTNPGTCNDTFGTRAPSTGGTSLGSGSTAAAFSEPLTGLAPGTTYFFCALGQNATGTGVGAVQTFTTPTAPQRPTVTTSPATSVTATSATLNGAANPNGQTTTGWFRYATTSPGACDDAFGTRLPATGAIALGSGSTTAAFSEPLTGLVPGTPYFFCAIAENATGAAFGSVSTFVTGVAPPVVTTSDPTRVTGTGATLAGTADPRGSETLAWFRLGDSAPTTCDDAFGTRVPSTGGFTIDAGAGPTPFTFDATGLAPKRTYFACAAASNLAGAAFGGLRTFTTPAIPPTVTTQAPELSGDAVIFRGAANPNGSETTGWFRHGTDRPQACDDSWGTRVPASGGTSLGSGRTAAAFSETVSGLPEGASYVCAIASNEAGLAFGELQSVTVPTKPGPEPQPTAPGCGCGAGGAGGLAWTVLSLLLARRRR